MLNFAELDQVNLPINIEYSKEAIIMTITKIIKTDQLTILIAVISLCFLFTSTLSAQNLKEGIQNTTQIIEGKKNLKRDSAELKSFQAKIHTFNNYFTNKNSHLANELKADIVSDMIREVAQSSIKADKARREIAQSSAEIRSDNRELKRDRKDKRRSHKDRLDDNRDLARDRADKRDDKRDRRDDVRDYENQLHRFERQSHILKTIRAYNFAFNTNNLKLAQANKVLLNEFAQTLHADLAATKRELKEDKKERREDRRERRDDKNERKEHKRRR